MAAAADAMAPAAAGRGDKRCCVCLDAVDYHGTALIECAGCALLVHVKCYGVSVPADVGRWHCEPCAFLLAQGHDPTPAAPGGHGLRPHCAICPIEGGALRQATQRGLWCHVLCVLWIPELSHSLRGDLDEALDLGLLDRSRETLKCAICGQRGGCIQCISGRCARPFHVLCALRAPSDVIFTGYNNQNQQVYHCKAHLGDVETRKFEMVDDSWRASPLLVKYAHHGPVVNGKCQICQSKVPALHKDRHAAQCLLMWLTKEEVRLRKKRMEALGIKPPAIAYAIGGHGKDGPAEGPRKTKGTASPAKKNRRNPQQRVCPKCGEKVRETLMMGHLKNRCRARGDAPPRAAKSPNATVPTRSALNGAAANTVDLTQENGIGSTASAVDLSDVLFATWPGQSAGSLLDSTTFWRMMNTHFFSAKVLLKKRMEPLCKNLCGAKLEDIGNFTHKANPHAPLLNCSDVVLFDRSPEQPNRLTLKSIVHRDDHVMRSSRMRCVDDHFAKPVVTLEHCAGNSCPTDFKPGTSSNALRVKFTNSNGDEADCRIGVRVGHPEPDDSNAVWSKFHHDTLSTIAGGALDKVPAECDPGVWMALEELSEIAPTIDLTQATDKSASFDELTPEIGLLMDKLNEQMRQNRFSMRTLCRKTHIRGQFENELQRTSSVTEAYYRQYAAWKTLCASLLTGYREFWRAVEESSDGDKGDKSDDEEEPIDDGTCVICFDGQSPESNPIIFCDRCDLAVHQRCYGVQRVPSNEFYCDRCRLTDDGRDAASEVYCQLCPLRDGAFKRTVDGKWVHVVCALWCPGVWVGDLELLADIKLVNLKHLCRFADPVGEIQALILPQREPLHDAVVQSPQSCLQQGSLCQYCRVACGRTIRCCHSDCGKSYHPLCGWFEGLQMTVRVRENSYVYRGGGGGLKFQMFCEDHLDDGYTPDMLITQRKNRRRFRIDLFYKTLSKRERIGFANSNTIVIDQDDDPSDVWTDQELCAACFEFANPVSDDIKDFKDLNKRQLMLRCQYCNTFIHAACCISDSDDVAELMCSNWICERCSKCIGDKTMAKSGCVLCDRTSDYMMPCSMYNDNSGAGIVKANSTLPNSMPIMTIGDTTDKWIHVFCAKMTKTKLYRRHHMLCTSCPSVVSDIIGRCDLCQQRGRNMVACGNCPKKFHPTCAARKKFFISRSNKSEWKFYCPGHPPAAVGYDEKRQSWFTGEIFSHLQELRRVLERGRMIVEMTRQRDRQKKRLLNLCAMPKMELSIEMILKKRPTTIMKDIFREITGEELTDIPKRAAPPAKSSQRHANDSTASRSRHRRNADESEFHSDISQGVRRSSARLSSSVDDSPKRPRESALEVTPSKRKRLNADTEITTPSRRSTRYQIKPENGNAPAIGNRASSRRSLVMNDEPSLVDALVDVMEPSDFDGVVEELYPQLIED